MFVLIFCYLYSLVNRNFSLKNTLISTLLLTLYEKYPSYTYVSFLHIYLYIYRKIYKYKVFINRYILSLIFYYTLIFYYLLYIIMFYIILFLYLIILYILL